MKKRKKEREYWERAIVQLFETEPIARAVEYRYNTLRYLLIGRYPDLKDLEKEFLLEVLRDAVYLDRKLRRETQGEQEEIKQTLSERWGRKHGYVMSPAVPFEADDEVPCS